MTSKEFKARLSKDMFLAIRSWRKERQAKDWLADRASMAERIAVLKERGKVAIVSGGMDCDCSVWDGAVTILPAYPMAVVRWTEDFYKWAEGPQHWGLEAPSIARGIERTSRDLAAESMGY